MDENKLIKKFIEISQKRWIKGVNNTTNSVGLTFESLLNKEFDSMYFPDYGDIEIKCSQRFSRYPISLFSISFDGPRLYEMNRLVQTYGKKDVIYKDKFQLQGSIYVNKYEIINKNYFKIKIDREHKKIIIGVYDINYQKIEEEIYISFETIKNRLKIKLTNLALILASKKKINNNLYFRYYQITLYTLKSFETFMNLLEKDIVKMTLVGRVSRSGEESGRQRNKNLVFSISKRDIDLLFNKNIEYNSDIKNISLINLWYN